MLGETRPRAIVTAFLIITLSLISSLNFGNQAKDQTPHSYNALPVTGSYSARLDVSNNSTSIRLNVTTVLAHITLLQYFPAKSFFDNLTDRPDGLNLSFYVQPKFTDYSIFEVRIRSGNVYEMDYIYSNPGISLGFGNSTTGSEAGKPLKQFLLPSPPLNQWNQLTRNLRRDWLAPLKLPNGTFTSGFPLNDTIYRFEVNAYFYKDSLSGKVYAETVWVDDVAIYKGNSNSVVNPSFETMPLLSGWVGDIYDDGNYYSTISADTPVTLPIFMFQDRSGNDVGSLIVQRIVDAQGNQVHISPGEIIPPGVYTLQAYYHGSLLYSGLITPITSVSSQLSMIPLDSSRSRYIAFNSTISTVNILENSQYRISFNATGTGPSLIIVSVPKKPLSVESDGQPTSSWDYNSTSGTVAIQATKLGTFSLILANPVPAPVDYLPLAIGILVAILALTSIAIIWRKRTAQDSQTAGSNQGSHPKNPPRSDKRKRGSKVPK